MFFKLTPNWILDSYCLTVWTQQGSPETTHVPQVILAENWVCYSTGLVPTVYTNDISRTRSVIWHFWVYSPVCGRFLSEYTWPWGWTLGWSIGAHTLAVSLHHSCCCWAALNGLLIGLATTVAPSANTTARGHGGGRERTTRRRKQKQRYYNVTRDKEQQISYHTEEYPR